MNINLSSTIHDLKNSLARILECPDQPSLVEIEAIRKIALNACSTLTSLLQIQSLSDDSMTLNKEYLEIDRFMREVYLDAKPFCKHPCHLVGSSPQDLFMIDRLLITQVLVNAVQNADRHTQTEVCISYRLNNDGDLVMEVKDNGPGFPDSLISNIKNQDEAMWFGIALGREIVRRHGGELCLKNNSGGIFSLRLTAA